MDTAGKDGTIRHVMSGVNPQGAMCIRSRSLVLKTMRTISLEIREGAAPAGDDRHLQPFLLRGCARGHVHPERMEELPESIGPEAEGFWDGRYKDINTFEKHLCETVQSS